MRRKPRQFAVAWAGAPRTLARLMNAFSRTLCLVSLAGLLAASPAFAQKRVGDAVAQIQRERVQASYVLAFGRAASEDEIKYWVGQNPKSVSELVSRHKQYLKQEAGTQTNTIKRSYVDALGRNPKDAEIKHWAAGNDSYTELMQKHIDWLGGNPAEQEAVIKRSYQLVFGRQPKPAELKYWQGQGVLSYAVLVGCHEDFKRANSATTEKVSGSATLSPNSKYLTTVTVSTSIASEAKALLRSASNYGIVAAGAGNIVGNAGSNYGIVAAGAGNLVAAGAGN